MSLETPYGATDTQDARGSVVTEQRFQEIYKTNSVKRNESVQLTVSNRKSKADDRNANFTRNYTGLWAGCHPRPSKQEEDGQYQDASSLAQNQ